MEANVFGAEAQMIFAEGGDGGTELDEQFGGFYFGELSIWKQDGIYSGVVVGSFVAADSLYNCCPETNWTHGGVKISLVSYVFVPLIVFLKFKMYGNTVCQWQTWVVMLEFFSI